MQNGLPLQLPICAYEQPQASHPFAPSLAAHAPFPLVPHPAQTKQKGLVPVKTGTHCNIGTPSLTSHLCIDCAAEIKKIEF